MKRSMLNKCLGKALFFILFSTVFVSSLPIVVGSPGTVVKVDPPSKTVTQGEIFSVDILVVDVTNLYIWQIKLFFNATVLECTGATYPSDHVFAGQPIIPVTPIIDNVAGFVKYGCTLLGAATPFNGSGKLCQITFLAKVQGKSDLKFSPYGYDKDTYLIDYEQKDAIPSDVEHGSVTVQSTTKPPSQISINVNPASIFVSESITISGYVYGKENGFTDPRPNINVTILKNNAFLAKVKTNSDGYYQYVWRTIGSSSIDDVGQHKIKARWDGDDTYQGAISEEKTVIVQNADPIIYIKYVSPTGEHHPTVPPEDLYLLNFTAPTNMYSGRDPPIFGPKTIIIPFNYTLYILISNVSNLYAWKFKLYVSNSSLAICNPDKIWVPQNGVFAGSVNIFERKVEPHANGYNITVAATQTPPNPSFSISGENATHVRIGILCAINFTSIHSKGSFIIQWFPENIELKDEAGDKIPYRFEDLYIEAGISADKVISTRKSTTISLDATPKKVKPFENVTLTGKVEPDIGDIVKIKITLNETELVKVDTVKPYNSTYIYVWTAPNATGTYIFQASWEGTLEYEGGSSDKVTVTVVGKEGEAGVDYTPYIIIIVVVIVIVGVAVYFKKFRKPPKIPVEEESA